MAKDIQRIGVGNWKYPGVDENVLPPEEIDFTFDSTIITFDSNIKTFDEQLAIKGFGDYNIGDYSIEDY